jgi:acetyl-CoA carboxylase biotin carboxyl carrier protein
MKKPTATKKKPAAKKVTVRTAKPKQGSLAIDKAAIHELAKILDDTGLSEISWSQGAIQVRVARGGVALAAPVAAAPAVAATAPAGAAPATSDHASHPGAVKSPMVGTAYVAAEPGSAPFVREGDTVKQGQTVLIVEAMKTMNPIPAPKGGRVTKIMVEDKQPVEFGQVLMVIE